MYVKVLIRTLSFSLVLPCRTTDSNSKKMMVVDDIAKQLGLENVRVLCTRAEKHLEKYDFLLGRAVSAIPNFLSFSSHLMRKDSPSPEAQAHDGRSVNSGLLYLKGGDFTEELVEARINPDDVSLFPVNQIVDIESDKYVLHIGADDILAFDKQRRMDQLTEDYMKAKSSKRRPKAKGKK
jgi:hypothetical protein